MQIIKRDGTLQEYSSEKIKNAIKKVFACQGKICPQDDLDEIIFDIEKAIVKIQGNTRRYCRKQLTWFKRDDNLKWFTTGQNIKEIINYIDKNR